MVVYTIEQRFAKCCAIDLQNMLIMASDQAHFDRGGYVNNQNYRIGGTENPHAYIEKPTHLKRITV